MIQILVQTLGYITTPSSVRMYFIRIWFGIIFELYFVAWNGCFDLSPGRWRAWILLVKRKSGIFKYSWLSYHIAQAQSILISILTWTSVSFWTGAVMIKSSFDITRNVLVFHEVSKFLRRKTWIFDKKWYADTRQCAMHIIRLFRQRQRSSIMQCILCCYLIICMS